MVRVAVGMISHETNSFSPVPTPLSSFADERIGILEGEDVVREHRGTKTGIGGFIEVGEGHGWEMLGTLAASAMPSGNVEAEAYSEMKARLLRRLREALPVDAVLLHLHGAMLAKNAADAEGDLVRAVREVVGPAVPIVVELDLHGNITPEFTSTVDGVFAYDTNPHIDPYERGLEAAQRLSEVLSGTLARPRVFISKPPMLPPTINMRTAEGPMHLLLERGRELEQQPGIVNVSVFGGFPYADFDQAGASIVVTATDPEAGQRAADELGRLAWQHRTDFLKELARVPQAVEQALRLVAQGGDKPVVLADVADNPAAAAAATRPSCCASWCAGAPPGRWPASTTRRRCGGPSRSASAATVPFRSAARSRRRPMARRSRCMATSAISAMATSSATARWCAGGRSTAAQPPASTSAG